MTECHHVQGGAEGGQLRSPHAGETWSQDAFHAGSVGVGDGGLQTGSVGEERGDMGRERTHREPGVMPERRASPVSDRYAGEGVVERCQPAQRRPVPTRGGSS
jgi:hypothetical protein